MKNGQRWVALVVAEFVGTYLLSTVMLASLVRTSFAFFSALAAGVVYGVMVLVLAGASESHLNPAVTIAMWTVRRVDTLKAVVYIAAQLLGGVVAWKVAEYFLGQSLNHMATGGWNWKVVLAEGVGTALFLFGLAAAYTTKLVPATRAFVAGASLFAGISVASLATNALLNPAVDIAARSWSWSYVCGPIIGGVVGVFLYQLLLTPSLLGSKAKK